jgi:hypothetical protein
VDLISDIFSGMQVKVISSDPDDNDHWSPEMDSYLGRLGFVKDWREEGERPIVCVEFISVVRGSKRRDSYWFLPSGMFFFHARK